MKSYAALALLLCLQAECALAQNTANPAPAEQRPRYGKLVDAPGAAVTFAFCSYCHSEQIIAQQGLSREVWAELLIWMSDEHGMPELSPQVRQEILDYLAEHYNEDRPNYGE